MYTGYPGRSAHLDSSPSGRYLFVLQTGGVLRDPVADSVFRLTASRYDCELDRFEQGKFAVDSCAVAFGHMGTGDQDLYFHLSCDYPSTIRLRVIRLQLGRLSRNGTIGAAGS